MKIIDAHIYIGESLFGNSQSIEKIQNLMTVHGVDKAVLAPSRPKSYTLWPANQMVADIIKQHPDRFYGWARVDPWQKEDALADLIRAREELGLHGLLLHPWEEQFQVSSPLVDPLVDYAASQNMPVMVEAGYPLLAHPMDIAELANRHPEATFIATHGLQLDSAAFALMDAEVVMHECSNIIMETSGMYAPDVMENLVRDLGKERLLFGSHSPWLNLQFEVERVKSLKLDTGTKSAVMGSNIERMLK
jgi:uncharacterized protein